MHPSNPSEIASRPSFCRGVLLLLHPVLAIGFAVFRLGIAFPAWSPMTDAFSHRVLKILRLGAHAFPGLSWPDPDSPWRPLGPVAGVVAQVIFIASCACVDAVLVVGVRLIRTA